MRESTAGGNRQTPSSLGPWLWRRPIVPKTPPIACSPVYPRTTGTIRKTKAACLSQAEPELEGAFAGLFKGISLDRSLRGFFGLVFVVLPEEPIKCYLGAEDGEEQGEDAVAEVVDPGGVDDEGGGDNDGGNDEEDGHSEHERLEGAPEDVVRLAPSLRLLR